MNIGNIGATTYNTWADRTNGAKKKGNDTVEKFLAKFDMVEEKIQKEEIEKRTEQSMDAAAKPATEENTLFIAEFTKGQ